MRNVTSKAEAKKQTYGLSWNSRPYDPARCVESVWEPGRGGFSHQCDRKPGFGPEGLYCKQHDPVEVERRRQASMDKWNRKQKAQRPQWYAWDMLQLLKESRAGITAEWEKKRDALIKKIEAD